MNTFFRFSEWIRFLFTSKSKYRIHSPFVFTLLTRVFERTEWDPALESIATIRKQCNTNELLTFEGFGAIPIKKKHTLNYINQNMSMKHKMGSRIYKMISFYGYTHILELGTCIGIGTMYMASQTHTKVITMEGNTAAIEVAKRVWKRAGLQNIEVVQGNINDTITQLDTNTTKFDLVYIDANHTFEATCMYYEQIKKHIHTGSVVILDDIHWSADMKKAWDYIKQDNDVHLSLDLFYVGMLFYKPDRLEKEHFDLWIQD